MSKFNIVLNIVVGVYIQLFSSVLMMSFPL
nr:MAG TPA: hypothetical protein [Inoviridae sp.]